MKLQPIGMVTAIPVNVDTDRALIELTVINESSKVIANGGAWAVKDENTNTVREAIFPRITPGSSASRSVSLPTGVEWGIFRFKAEDGSGEWTAPHGGNNTEQYTLTLSD